MTRAILAAGLSAGVGAAALVGMLAPPPRSLARRLRRHLAPAMSRLGRPVQLPRPRRVWRLPLEDQAVALRLHQSGIWPAMTDDERAAAYRARVVVSVVVAGLSGAALGVTARRGALSALAIALIGASAGGAIARGGVDRAIRRRRDRIRVELSTVAQLLAMWIRTGGGVVLASREITDRATGEVVDELSDALRMHRSGLSATDAFRRIAELTPDAYARRCYQVLASAEQRGSDVAVSLLAIAHDLRADRREALRRDGTRRRAAMLLPLIGVLGPVLILFVAAPLPWIVLRAVP